MDLDNIPALSDIDGGIKIYWKITFEFKDEEFAYVIQHRCRIVALNFARTQLRNKLLAKGETADAIEEIKLLDLRKTTN